MASTTGSRYIPCTEADIPVNVRFDTPRSGQGQIVEVSYGTMGRAEAGRGDPWMRRIDRSTRQVEYFRLAK